MKKSTILKWLFVVVVAIFCIVKLVGLGDDELIYEADTEEVPAVVIDGSEPPAIKVNIVTKDDTSEKEADIVEIDKTMPKFSLEVGEASYDIYSNSLTKIPADASGEYFFYTFKDGNEITVYLQEKGDMLPLEEMESNYADAKFCEENNIRIFDKQVFGDNILYLLSYSDSATPDVIEVWKENEKAILNVYYVNYEEAIDEAMIDSVKDFINHIEDTTAQG